MTAFQHRVWFQLAEIGPLHIVPQLAGTDVVLPVENLLVRVRFPRHGEMLGPDPLAPAFGGSEENPSWVGVRIVETSIDFEADPGEDGSPIPHDEQNHEVPWVEVCEDAARVALARIRAWARLKQPWIGLADSPPRRIAHEMTNLATGESVKPGSVISLTGMSIATLDEIIFDEETLALVSGNPPAADSLLADARYMAHWAAPPDPQRSVLIAAIACELKVKQTLQAAVRPGGREILQVLLDNPRSFPQSAHELFDSVSEAVIGRSLRKDNRELFNGVRTLFVTRNGIAHRGEVPSNEEAAELVRKAMDAFNWLNEVVSNVGSTPGGP